MAKKDVQLVIRAKNEASSTLDKVAGSLDKLNKELLENAQTGKTASSGMEALGNDVSQLAKRLEGLRGIGTAAQGLNSVKTSIAGMGAALSKTANDFVTFARQSRQMASAIAAQREEAARLGATLDSQRAKVEEARQATLKRADASRELLKAENALKTAQAKPGENAAAIVQATQRYQAAKTSVDALTATHTKLKSELADIEDAYNTLTTSIRSQEREQTRLNNKRDQSLQEARQQKTAVDETVSAYSSLEAQLRETGNALGAMSMDQKELAAATQKTEQALREQEAALAAMKRYSTGAAGGFADPKTAAALREQRGEVDRVREAWKALETDIRRQAEAMRGVVQPTQAQVTALQNTVQAARQAKAEHNQLAAAVAASERAFLGANSHVQAYEQHLKRLNDEMGRTPRNPPRSAWESFYRSVYGESRTAMSWTQRLRGEVLALGTAYLGLFGVINQVGGVINAYQGLEAAQNRLGVVFKQNGDLVRTELLWLERQAARLGIEFGTLSDQYGKFSIAADSANFSSEATREVFMAVAEAGRVAKLSNDQLKGTFLALEQMISKGKIQAEELRGQLGERLPGAVSILAKALGVGTDELSKMMEQGQVLANEDNMLKFAAELNRQFGPQLAASLQSTSANIGRFFNNIYQAQLQVAKGGLMEGLNKALIELDKFFQSREGRDFFLSLGAAAGKALEILAQLPQYFTLIGDAVKLIIALKMAQWFSGIISNMEKTGVAATVSATKFTSWGAVVTSAGTQLNTFKNNVTALRTNIVALPGALAAAGTGFNGMAAKAAASRASLTALNATIAGVTRAGSLLFAAFGGWVGIAATAVTFIASGLIADWVGGVDDATAAIDEHERIIQRVLTAYESVGKATKDWKDNIEDVNLAQAESTFIEQTEIYDKALEDLQTRLRNMGTGDNILGRLPRFEQEQIRQVRDFAASIKQIDGDNIDEFMDSLVDLNSEITNTDAKKLVLELMSMAQAALDAEGRTKEAAAVAKLMGSVLEGLGMTTEEATAYIDGLAKSAKESGDGLGEGEKAADSYQESLKALRDMLPSVTAEMKKLQDASSLDNMSLTAARDALALGPKGPGIGAAMDAYGRANSETMLAEIDTTPLQSSLDYNSQALKDFYNQIKGQANFGERRFQGIDLATLKSAEWQNANLATITTSGGFKQQIHREAAAAFQGFINELESTGYQIKQFGGYYPRPKKDTRGNEIPGTISQHSYGYATDINWDQNPFMKQLKTDFPKEIGLMAAKYGLSWGGDWQGNKDAMHFEYTGQKPPGASQMSDFQLKAQQEQTTELLKQNEIRSTAVQQGERELALQKLKALGDERAVAVREALNAATDKGITDNATLWKLADQAGQKWDNDNAARVATQQEQTAKTIADLEAQNGYQELINAGKERQAAIEQGIAAAKAADPSLAKDEARLAQLEELIGKQYDLANAEKNRNAATEEAEQRVNDLLAYRSTLMETLQMQTDMGDTAGAQATQQALAGVNTELQAAINNAIAMWQAIGGPAADAAIAKLQNTQLQIQGTRNQMGAFGLSMQQWQGIAQNFASGLTGVFKKFAQAIGQGENAMEALGEAFLQFAAEFLIQIGEMIIQQAIFNAMQGAGGGGGGGGLFGLIGGLFGMGHTGGRVGSSGFIGSGNGSRSWADILPSFHGGGIVGLGPTETLNVLEVGEEVLTRDDPRHMLNGGKSPGPSAAPVVNLKNINMFDSGEVVREALSTDVGEEAVINVVRKNPSVFRDIVNGA